MITFITTLRHPENAANYSVIESLLQDSLRSVCAQTNPDFSVIVVGNRQLAFEPPDGVTFVEVEFDPPGRTATQHASRDDFVYDKGTKVGAGLLAARAFAPSAVMLFDADDFISRGLVEFIACRPPQVWKVSEGLMFSRTRNSYRPLSDFNRTCGTCFVVPYDIYQVPPELTASSSQVDIAEGFGERLRSIMGAHRDAEEWFIRNTGSVTALPFPAAVYQVDTSENHSGKQMRGLARPVDAAIAAEFGLPDSPMSPARQWLSARGPVPLGQTVSARLRDAPRRFRAVRGRWRRGVVADRPGRRRPRDQHLGRRPRP